MTSRTLVTLLVLASPLLAQPGAEHPSHVPVPKSDAKPSQILAQRLGRLKQDQLLAGVKDSVLSKLKPQEIGELLKGNVPPGLLERLGGDSKLMEQLKQLDRDDPTLRQRFADMAGGVPNLKGYSSDDLGKLLGQLKDAVPRNGASSTPGTTGTTPPITPPQGVSAEEAERRRALAERLSEWAKGLHLDRLPDGLRDSPALKQMADDLRGMKLPDGPTPNLPSLPEGVSSHLPSASSWKDWLPRDFSMPDLSNLRLPRMSWPFGRPNLSAPSMPSVGPMSAPRFQTPSVPALLTGLVVLVTIAVLARYWKLPARIASVVKAVKVGPWPVDPNKVRTPADVVRAWEYVAERHLGQPALYQHHRASAGGLSRELTNRTAAVDAAARLYEQARYAPQGPTANEIAAASAHFAALAGAAGA